jgi:hypothetical protein
MFAMYSSCKLRSWLLLALTLAGISSAQTRTSGIATTSVSAVGSALSPSGAKIVASGARSVSITTHERFVFFWADEGFVSELLLQNMRLDVPVTARVALILEGRELPLQPITLAPHNTATVNINTALQSAGHGLAKGLAVVRYDSSTYAALSAVVTASDVTHHLYLNFTGQSAEELWSGNTFDGVVWSPDKEAQGFITLINTYTAPISVHSTFSVEGNSEQGPEVVVAPHEHRLIRIDSLLQRSLEFGAGIHLEFAGDPGSIVAEATLFNKGTGFAKHIQFMDKALHFATSSRRTHFLLLGPQPAGDSFPAQISFRSVAAVRNIDSGPIQVTPTVKYLRNGSVQTITLAPINLDVNQSRLLDFSGLREAGRLPAGFSQGSLELTPNTDHTSIVTELFNFDERNKGYVVGPSFGAHPMRSSSSIWRTDGTFQTTIMIENTADKADQVNMQLFSAQGSYEKLVDVPSQGMVKINIKELQQNAVPDKDGNLLLGTSGTLHLSGSHGGRSALAFDKLIHSASDSEYVGLPAQPCDYVQDFSPIIDSNSNTWITEYWTDGTSDTFGAQPFSYDSSVVNVGSNSIGPTITLNPSPTGSTFTTNPEFQDIVLDCTACSTREQDHPMSLPVPVPDHLLVLNDKSTTQNCGSNPGSDLRAILYEIKDQNDLMMNTSVSMRENVPVTVSSCNNQTVQTAQTCTANVFLQPGVLSEFIDALSPGCPVPASNSPCGYTFANQQWQYCPSSSVPQSMGTIGQDTVQNITISVAGNTFGLIGHVFAK